MSHFQKKNCTISWKAVNAQLKREKNDNLPQVLQMWPLAMLKVYWQ